MSPKGRPKKNSDALNLWIVEQYYHGDDSTQSWGKPIKVCYDEDDAVETMELEALSYAESIEYPEIDRSLNRMITVRPNNGISFYPNMDFWYYHSILVDDDEEEV